MTNDEAFAELDRRGVRYERVGPHGTTRAPIRLGGRLHGVDIHGALPAEQRASSMFEVLDARLALALDDFAAILERHDVVEVVHYSLYRPNVPAPDPSSAAPEKKKSPRRESRAAKRRPAEEQNDAPDPPARPRRGVKTSLSGPTKSLDLVEIGGGSSLAKKANEKRTVARRSTTSGAPERARAGRTSTAPAKPHRKWAPPGERHPAGLAIDLAILKKRDGTILTVASDFHGAIGQKTCGAGAPKSEDAGGAELRDILCEARERGVFTYALTPNYDHDHADHFHLELKPGVGWFMYQ